MVRQPISQPTRRRRDDAERRAHAELAAGRWDADRARWYVLGHEALTADGRVGWWRAGAPRRRADDRWDSLGRRSGDPSG